MENSTELPPAHRRFVVRMRPPVRAYLLAAIASVVGAVLLVWWRDSGLPVVVGAVGIASLVLGVALALAALAVTLRTRTTLLLEADTLTVVTGLQRRVLTWSEISDVTMEGSRLVFGHRDAGRSVRVLVDPRQQTQPAFTAMIDAVRRRLDASRGYRN